VRTHSATWPFVRPECDGDDGNIDEDSINSMLSRTWDHWYDEHGTKVTCKHYVWSAAFLTTLDLVVASVTAEGGGLHTTPGIRAFHDSRVHQWHNTADGIAAFAAAASEMVWPDE
jgi:hypothetical protein